MTGTFKVGTAIGCESNSTDGVVSEVTFSCGVVVGITVFGARG